MNTGTVVRMNRRASLNLPTGKRSTAGAGGGAGAGEASSGPFGDGHRTPCPVSRVAPPRKVSR